ncbi:single-stranded DNA-binding protein [Candidatus Margulisiibacteriota bacterium]
MKKVILTGRLAADPIVGYTKENAPVCSFGLSVMRKPDNKKIVMRCTAFGGLAKVCGEYLEKGRLVAIEGKLQEKKCAKKARQKSSQIEIVIENLQMLDSKFFKQNKI